MLVSLCFDDGLKRSSPTILDLFEARGLSACFAVLAAPERTADSWIRAAGCADWGFWCEAAARGHAVEPHGFAHEHLGRLPFVEAAASVEAAFDIFARELPGFSPSEAVFHLPYLVAAPDLIDWLAPQVRAVRLATAAFGSNDRAEVARTRRLSCACFGPDGVADAARARLDAFRADESDWLVLAFHGVDGEGWGPIESDRLGALLDELAADPTIRVAPPSHVLKGALA